MSLLLLSIGSISAADNQTTDINPDSSDITIENQDINKDIKYEYNNNENKISNNEENIISDNQNIDISDNNKESLYKIQNTPIDNDDKAIIYNINNNTKIDNNVFANEPNTNITINNTTFNNYFDTNGSLKSNVTQDLLIFKGNFSNLPNLTINKNVTLDGSNASFYNIGINVNSDNVTIKGFTFNIDSLDTLINVLSSNILITDNIINFNIMNNTDNVVIRIENSNNVTINRNIITVKGNNTSGHSNGIILTDDVDDLIIANNMINAKLPSASNSYGPAPDYKTEYGSYVIQTTGNSNSISNNDISLEYSNVAGSYDSIYAVIVSGNDNNINNNNINVKGRNYAYGVSFAGKNININSNIIDINSENYYSVGVTTSTGVNTSGIISNNNITVKSRNVTYGTASYGDVNLTYKNNIINANSNSIYAMELMGKNENVINNTIIANGNYTIGIASSGNSILSIEDNNISITGEGLGNATLGDSINSINAAIYLTEYTSNAVISGNTINANIPSRPWDVVAGGLVINAENTVIDNNNIDVKVTNAQGDYNSLYGVNINTDNVKFNNNILYLEGGQYAYALSISGKNMTVDSNNITVITNSTYADGISISSFNGVINNNIVDATAADYAYGIYSSAWSNNTIVANYTNNKVNVNSNISYALELMGTEEIVSNNYIIANGNYTIGITTNTPTITINNNTIRSNGIGKTNGSSVDMFGATNQGILIYDNNTKATINNNNITTTGKYAVNVLKSKNNISTVTNNYLIANNLTGNSAVNNITGTVKNNIPISNSLLAEDVVKYFRNGTQYNVKVLDSQGNPVAGQKVIITVNGRSYTKTSDENGIATLNINLNPGEYIITSSYNGSSISNNITVLSTLTDNNNLVKYFRNGTQYNVKVLDSQGNPVAGQKVTFNINGRSYTKTSDINGIATLNINLNPGEYIITSSYNGLSVSNTINVLSVIKTENIEMTTTNRIPFTATILGPNGQPIANQKVTFNINGKFYTKTTNTNGIANLNINLNKGRYIISTIYNGQTESNTINIL